MIIGITGTLGAGKGTAVEYLVNEKGFTHLSAREFFIEEVTRRGLPVNRDTITEVANDLRTKHGLTYAVEHLFAQAKEKGGDAVLESIRTPSEGEFLKAHGALLWAVDADRELRYERIVKRGSETDHVTFDEFVAHEEREMHSTDPAKQSIAQVMAMADHIFHSNGSKEELYVEVEEALQEAGFKA
ncbi:MAG: AAA family ATPase [Candidatus Adlerbacteria bacterium]